MLSPQTPHLLTATNLGRRHPAGQQWLFRDIDLALAGGTRLALVGPTGSGKSLILRALALLDPVDSGEVSWRGSPVTDSAVPGFRSRVVYLQQRSPVVEGTVESNLRLPFTLAQRSGQRWPRSEARRVLETLGRPVDFLRYRTANLSGGERQLVALARALLVGPSVLLLDEPSAALDSRTSEQVEATVAHWQAESPQQRAYLWVTHDARQAERVADRLIHLQRGMLEGDR